MSIKTLFMSGDKKKRMSHVRNLIALSYMDGVMTSEEKEVILSCAAEMGMTPDELAQIIDDPSQITFYVPRKTSERIEEIYDMVLLMMSDGEMDEREIQLCKAVAEKMHLDPEIVDAIVKDIVEMITDDIVYEAGVRKIMEDAGLDDDEDDPA